MKEHLAATKANIKGLETTLADIAKKMKSQVKLEFGCRKDRLVQEKQKKYKLADMVVHG